jgi:small-conductance mechanosensitive channel
VISHPDILDDPEPLFLFHEFGNSSLNFNVRFWTVNHPNWLKLQSEMTVAINNAFKKAGIEIPFPQRDLHIRSVEDKVIQDMNKDQPTKQRRKSGTN